MLTHRGSDRPADRFTALPVGLGRGRSRDSSRDFEGRDRLPANLANDHDRTSPKRTRCLTFHAFNLYHDQAGRVKAMGPKFLASLTFLPTVRTRCFAAPGPGANFSLPFSVQGKEVLL